MTRELKFVVYKVANLYENYILEIDIFYLHIIFRIHGDICTNLFFLNVLESIVKIS